MTCGDLFAGIGGMSLGLERAGFTVCWQVEREPYCETVLARHWPAVARRRDVRFAGAGTLEQVDLIAGGFPCQDVSTAGKGAGLERGHRSGLWREFARIIGELRPRWVLVENVPALRRRGADIVLGDLETAGYACWPLVVGARHVGAPHRRDRVWIVGYARGSGLERRGCYPASAYEGRWGGAARPAQVGNAGVGQADSRGIALWNESRRSIGPCGAGAAEPRATGVGLADADRTRCAGERGGGLLDGERSAFRDDLDRCHLAVGQADRNDARLEGRRVPRCERAHQWPARPGHPPHDWEQPRTVESALGRRAHGVSARLASARWRNELKALGNAVVPAVVEVIGRAILAVEEARHD